MSYFQAFADRFCELKKARWPRRQYPPVWKSRADALREIHEAHEEKIALLRIIPLTDEEF